MAPRFFGMQRHSLDAKGRVTLPARYRGHFPEQRGFLTQFDGPCLALWTPEDFDRQMRAMEDSQSASRADRNLARVWAAGTDDPEIDRQGRIAIPGYLREFAQLEGEILVNGAIDRIELWNPELWEERIRPSERQLTDAGGVA